LSGVKKGPVTGLDAELMGDGDTSWHLFCPLLDHDLKHTVFALGADLAIIGTIRQLEATFEASL
jgi:hypothetical protein